MVLISYSSLATSLATPIYSDAKKFFDVLILAIEIEQPDLHRVIKQEFLKNEKLATVDSLILAKIRRSVFPHEKLYNFSRHLYSASYLITVLWPVLEWAIEHDNSAIFTAITKIKRKNNNYLITEKTLRPYDNRVDYVALIDYYDAKNIKNMRASQK